MHPGKKVMSHHHPADCMLMEAITNLVIKMILMVRCGSRGSQFKRNLPVHLATNSSTLAKLPTIRYMNESGVAFTFTTMISNSMR